MRKPKLVTSKRLKPDKKKQSSFRKRFIKAGKILSIAISVWLLGMLVFGVIYQQQHRHDPVIIGTSFSKSTAEHMGSDWRANFIALLDDLKIRNYRLNSNWSEHEADEGVVNFEDLDWQMLEASKRGAKVTLSIGLRQPRWPECHQADWARKLYSEDEELWQKKLFSYMSEVVKRYKDHPALESWHLENEYYNRNFGLCDDFSTERLSKEIDLIKQLDSKNPVVLTLSDQLGFPLKGPKGDIFATSLYRGNYVKYIGYFSYPIPTHFYSSKAFFIKLLRQREIYIHELQLEPWGPKSTKYLTIKEQDYYMNVGRMENNISFALDTGMKKMYFWGAEWWYWRKVNFNDPGPWEVVRKAIP